MKAVRTLITQRGQSMVEYTIVLVFGVMVLTTGPGGDVMADLLKVMKGNYQGYSYAVSISDYPDHDSLGEYLSDPDVQDKLDPNVLVSQVGKFTQFPALEQFPDIASSPQDILESAVSFFP